MADWNVILDGAARELHRIASEHDVGGMLAALGCPPEQADEVLGNALAHIDSVRALAPDGTIHFSGKGYEHALWLDGFALGLLAARIEAGAPADA